MLGPQGISSPASLPLPPVVKSGATVHGANDARRVQEMAKEFEATFLSMLLKEMRQSLEPDGFFPGDSGDVQGGLFDLYLGKHLADSGRVGFAAALIRQMPPTASPAQPLTPSDVPPRPASHLVPPASPR